MQCILEISLKKIKSNWEKINNSTISTLRETFLNRDGVLVRSNADFKLNIDKKPYKNILKRQTKIKK